MEYLRFALTNKRIIPVLMKLVTKMESMTDLTYLEV
jgi:hypothetical protein